MTRIIPPLTLLLLAGCATSTDEHGGIYVGNPSMVALRVADPAPAATVDSGELALDSVTIDHCDSESEIAVADVHDLLGEVRYALEVGDLCGITVHVAGPLTLSGTHNNGEDWSVTLELEDVEVKIRGNVERIEGDLVFELGRPGWLQSEIARANGPIEVGSPASEAHKEVASRLWDEAYLFVDNDKDGWLSAEERRAEAIGAVE